MYVQCLARVGFCDTVAVGIKIGIIKKWTLLSLRGNYGILVCHLKSVLSLKLFKPVSTTCGGKDLVSKEK